MDDIPLSTLSVISNIACDLYINRVSYMKVSAYHGEEIKTVKYIDLHRIFFLLL